MRSTKRIQLTVLLVVGVALFAGALALAQAGDPITLTNVTRAGDADHLATGQATLAKVKYLGSYTASDPMGTRGSTTYLYTGQLTVTCRGLTPLATYSINGVNKTVNAAKDGTLQARGNWDFEYVYGWYGDPYNPVYYGISPEVHVSRVNPDRSQTLVLYVVLPYPPPYGR